MIIAMVAVRMMQVTVDEIVNVVPVRDGLVAAPRPMDMGGIVAATAMLRRARVRVGG
jgi:hypothetical protein